MLALDGHAPEPSGCMCLKGRLDDGLNATPLQNLSEPA